jgi:hypothetical protein
LAGLKSERHPRAASLSARRKRAGRGRGLVIVSSYWSSKPVAKRWFQRAAGCSKVAFGLKVIYSQREEILSDIHLICRIWGVKDAG